MKANKTGREPSVRVKQDPVTGRLESTVLDEVQRVFERLVGNIDNGMLALSTADQYCLAQLLMGRIENLSRKT